MEIVVCPTRQGIWRTLDIPQRTNLENVDQVTLENLSRFAQHFLQWEIPPELRDQRYGIVHFHHPTIIAALQEHTPEARLLALIDAEVFMTQATEQRFTATELERRLTRDDSSVTREARQLFSFSSACGMYLSRLANAEPERVRKATVHGQTGYRIFPPPRQEAGGDRGPHQGGRGGGDF